MMNEWIISSSVLTAAVLLGRLLLRGRISLRLQYALWGIVLLRLLVPVQFFTSDFGTGSMAREMDISTPVRQAYASANEDRYEAVYNETYRQLEAQYAANSWSIAPDTIEKEAYTMVQEAQKLDLNQLLQRIWLGGMALMTAVIVSCNVHLACQLRKRRWALDVPASLLPVYVTEAVPTPCVFGFFRPAIYLTPDAARGSQVRAHVLEHELTHYRHGDHIWSVLRSLCLVLHWYNPLVWLAAKVSRADAELACDEGALARLGESQRGDYGRTLIGLTCSAPISELLLTATTMTGSAGSIRERIKLLMKRPRNTVLTVTAVILLVTLIVGCTFSAAPATTPPATEPTETTTPGVDNDMAYTDQDLPIPDDLTWTDVTYALPMEQAMADYADKNPRALTEQELKEFRAAFTTTDENGNVNPAACFLLPYYDDISEMDGGEFLAYFPTDLSCGEADFDLLKAKYPDFFADWTWETMPIPIHRYDPKAIDAVVSRFGNIHWPELDEGVHYLEETGCYYNYTSDFGLGGFYAREGFVFDGGAVVYSDFSALYFTETAGYYSIRAHYPLIGEPEDDLTEEVAALFGENADPWYLAALTAPYAVDWWDFDPVAFFSAGQTAVALTKEEQSLITEVYGKEALEKTIFRMHYGRLEQVLDTYIGTDLGVLNLPPFLFCPETESYLLVCETVPALRRPEILTCQQLDENEVCMIYRFPGEEQTYCATLRRSETWKVRSNQLLLAPPSDARALTDGELEQVHTAFAPDTAPLSCFVLGSYADISEMSQARFLSYYPTAEYGGATEEEFRLLKQKYPADFENAQTLRDMNWPITPIRAEEVRALMEKYTLVDWDDLPQGGFLHYLEETDSYYVYYSDAGLFGFHCTAGWVYEGGAMLFGQEHVLILTEQNGTYYIQAHLPAIVLGPPSSHPMIPAPETEVSDPRDADVTALVTAFNRAYQENLYMGTDNPYDHLTVLALDPEITVTWEGKTVPLSEFHKNIQFLHDKQTWYHHTRSYGDETQEEYAMSSQVSSIQYDGDTAIVVTTGGIQFADDDPAAPRGEGAVHRFLLVQVDGIWLVADVLSEGEGFDRMYKNNPDFDVEKLISN